MSKTVDSIQQHLTEYAGSLTYAALTPEAVHAAKVRVIDTLGALIGGFFSEPCGIARNCAAQMPISNGASVIGTRLKTTPDMAALVNGTTARYAEMNDVYFWPGSVEGHPSDVIMPILGAAEYEGVGGREFITGVVLAYEVFLRMCDALHNLKFDNTNFACLATAIGSGKVMGLSAAQLSHCISMAVVPNIILKQVRKDPQSMYKGVAAGHAGRAGVFAALLAREGMEGPHLPFEGKAGWCEHVAHKQFSLNTMGGKGTPFKILDTFIKSRPAAAKMISSILAAEKVAPLKNIRAIKQIIVEVYKKAQLMGGEIEPLVDPVTRDVVDHNLSYIVAATLIDGTMNLRTFDESHLSNPELRLLMQKIEVVENKEFTQACERVPVKQYTRITVITADGERLIGEVGNDKNDLPAAKSDAQIEEKFRGYTEDVLGATRVNAILNRLWQLEDLKSVTEIPLAFILD